MPDRREDAARLELLRILAGDGYQFTTPAPSTHRRILLRRGRVMAATAEDVFGWNLPFDRQGALAHLAPTMEAAAVLQPQGREASSRLRVASVGPLLFLHSAFPPRRADSVFMGPDSYAFVNFIRKEMPDLPDHALIADIGAGTGVGGIFAKTLAPHARLVLSDVNSGALELARVNAAFAGQDCAFAIAEGVPTELGPFDLILANPPYIGGKPGKVYSDGGGALGAEASLAWARAAIDCLKPGGRLLLYTGSAITRDGDALREALARVSSGAGCDFRYEELDPDVFPSTLLHRAYWGVERIASVGAVIQRRLQA